MMALTLQGAYGFPLWRNPCEAAIKRCDSQPDGTHKRGIEGCLDSLPIQELGLMCRLTMYAGAAGEQTIPTHDAQTTAAAASAAAAAAEEHKLHHRVKVQSNPPPTLSLPLLLLLLAVLPLLVSAPAWNARRGFSFWSPCAPSHRSLFSPRLFHVQALTSVVAGIAWIVCRLSRVCHAFRGRRRDPSLPLFAISPSKYHRRQLSA